MDPGAFLSELRRRRVFRVGGAYLVVAFVLLQVTDLVAEPLRLPTWTMALVVVLLGLGLPIALLLAWAFDVGPDGVRRAEPLPGRDVPHANRAVPRTRLAGAVGLGIIVALVGFGGYAALRPAEGGAPDVERIRTIAVLPFVNMSPNPDHEYFSDGITEELLNVLAQVPGLGVAARTSSFEFKGETLDLREVGRRLNVQSVLEGSVRRDGEDVRITAQLIDTETGYHLWSQTYDRKMSSVFAAQDEISRAIVDALEMQLGDAELPDAAAGATGNRNAHDLYLLGLHRWNERTFSALQEALDYFSRAVAADPDYARAHAGLALTYAVITQYGPFPPQEARTKGRAAAERALALGPGLPEAHAALSQIAQYLEYDLATAERRARRAIELNPNYATAHSWLAEALGALGRVEEAQAANRRAREIDPLALPPRILAAYLLFVSGRLEEADAAYTRTLEIAPDAVAALANGGMVALLREDYERAADLFARATRAIGGDPEAGRLVVRAMREPSLREPALAALAEEPPTVAAASFQMLLGDGEAAMLTLERAYEQRLDPHVVFAIHYPVFEPIRHTERFGALARRMGVEPLSPS